MPVLPVEGGGAIERHEANLAVGGGVGGWVEQVGGQVGDGGDGCGEGLRAHDVHVAERCVDGGTEDRCGGGGGTSSSGGSIGAGAARRVVEVGLHDTREAGDGEAAVHVDDDGGGALAGAGAPTGQHGHGDGVVQQVRLAAARRGGR